MLLSLLRLASGSNDGSVQIWDVARGTVVRTWDGFEPLDRAFGEATDVAYSPDGRFLAGLQSHPSGRLMVWRVDDGTRVLRFAHADIAYFVNAGSGGDRISIGAAQIDPAPAMRDE
jgi:WD40 repeat protein